MITKEKLRHQSLVCLLDKNDQEALLCREVALNLIFDDFGLSEEESRFNEEGYKSSDIRALG